MQDVASERGTQVASLQYALIVALGVAAFFDAKALGFSGVQALAAVVALVALLLAVVLVKRRDALVALGLLAKREAQLAEAQEIARIVSWEWDVVGDAMSWSGGLQRVFGQDESAVKPGYAGLLNCVHPDDRTAFKAAVSGALEGRLPFSLVHRVVRSDWEVRTIETHCKVVCDAAGTPIRLSGSSQDITSFQLAEAKFRQLLDLAPDAIVGIGAKGRIELINSQVEHLFGYQRDELIGARVEQLVPERFRGAHEGHRDRYFRDPRTRPMGAGLELYARRKDGTEFPCEISLSSIQEEKGSIGVAAIRDVTQRKADEAEADRLKSEFFGLVSHELRTPLTSIQGYSELLADRERSRVSEAGRGFLDVIVRNARRLDRLVQDLLLVTQVEAGTFGIDVGEVDPEKLARHCEEEATPVAESEGVTLSVAAEPLPHFAGDQDRLAQVLDNLVSNAIKFSSRGGRVEVVIGAHRGECMIEVSDTGIGIPAEQIPLLFDRFFRSASDGQVQGIGLGLAITKAIVERHWGRIKVLSEPGIGSTFRVMIPMGPAPAAQPGPETAIEAGR
jgi:protein-histidine pros-kinase